jgi:hypothetical protein
LLLPNWKALLPLACICRKKNTQRPMISSQGSARISISPQPICASRALMRTPAASSWRSTSSESRMGARVRKVFTVVLRASSRHGCFTRPSKTTPSVTVTSSTFPARSCATNSE